MSYNFYSLVSSIKDKSSQAMATLSSDLKEFTSIVQEDVAEVAKTVRKTVHEQSEALRQRVDTGEEDEQETTTDVDAVDELVVERRSSIGSMFSIAGLSLEAVSSKILQSADGLLETLARAGAVDGEIDDDDEAEDASARRYRLLALQEDPQTYTEPPMDVETFKKWRAALDADELASIQHDVLENYPTVAEKLATLVPDAVAVEDFWANYIYKASLLAAQEQRGADLLEHALNDSDEEVGWDVESPSHTHGTAPAGRFPSYEEDDDGQQLPILEGADGAPEPSSPAPVLGEKRAHLPDESDDDMGAPLDAVSSDGESWIELDEQRRDAAAAASVVPTVGPRDGVVHMVGSEPKGGGSGDDEDVDWGEEEEDETAHGAAVAAEAATATPETKARGPDWGEWD